MSFTCVNTTDTTCLVVWWCSYASIFVHTYIHDDDDGDDDDDIDDDRGDDDDDDPHL